MTYLLEKCLSCFCGSTTGQRPPTARRSGSERRRQRMGHIQLLEPRSMLTSLVGVDFGTNGDVSPVNWTSSNGNQNGNFADFTINNLIGEDGVTTNIDLSVAFDDGTAMGVFSSSVNPADIPTHSNALIEIDDVLVDQSGITFTFRDLNPGTTYELYVFGGDQGNSFSQDVIISGQTVLPPFTQNWSFNQFVNSTPGSNAELSSFAVMAQADSGGQIEIRVQEPDPTQLAVVPALAIREVASPPPAVLGELVGVDFGAAGDVSPVNWNSTSSRGNQNFSEPNLIDETGAATGIGLLVEFDGGTGPGQFNRTTVPAMTPTHVNSLLNISGEIVDDTGLTFTFSGLNANSQYQVFVLGGSPVNSFSHDVTITGATALPGFTQSWDDSLFVNDQPASTDQLGSFALVVNADDSGEIQIRVQETSPRNFAVIPALALREVLVSEPEPERHLIGLDFGPTGDLSPQSWNSINDDTDLTVTNLIDESGAITDVDVHMAFDGGIGVGTFPANVNPAEVPSHTNALDRIAGVQVDNVALTYTFSELSPNTFYEVYVFGGGDQPTFSQEVMISGASVVPSFTQAWSGNLFVNASVGSNASLNTFATLAESDSGGQLQIHVQESTPSDFAVVSALAIREAEPPVESEGLSIADLVVDEDIGTVMAVISLDQAATSNVTVDVTTSDLSGIAGNDYITTSQTVTILAGQLSASFPVNILNDTAIEPLESFRLTLSNPIGSAIHDGEADILIMDNDGPASLSIADLTVGEGDGSAIAVVSLSRTLPTDVSVNVATSGFTATGNVDYGIKNSRLTIPAGELTATFEVGILEDSLEETTEVFRLNLNGQSGAPILDRRADISITDNDAPSGISIGDATVAEDAGSAEVTVTLTPASSSTVTVIVRTANGTATAGDDFVLSSTPITFAPGQTIATANIAIVNDSIPEPDEHFEVRLVVPNGATIADGVGIVTIQDASTAAFRTIDGTSNNFVDGVEAGSAGTKVIRFGYPHGYVDGIGDDISQLQTQLTDDAQGNPTGVPFLLPGAREISNSLFVQNESLPNDRNLSDWIVQWGQFLTHDMDLTGNGAANDMLSSGAVGDFNIPVPAGDILGPGPIPFHRSHFAPDTGDGTAKPNGQDNHREQINEITSFIDASNVYGSDDVRAAELRTFSDGKLKTTANGLLPHLNSAGLPNDNASSLPDEELFLAGDARVNEQIGLTSTHSLFVREHNRLASLIKVQNPAFTDEEIYQWARKIVGAQMQIITYEEFLPALMGASAPDPSAFTFVPGLNPAITNSFANAFFRFGHSMQSQELLLVNDSGAVVDAVNLREAFFNPEILKNDPTIVDLALKGLAHQVSQENDLQLIDDIRDFLFGPPGAGGLDLGALDLQRGRDHGLLAFNDFRPNYGLSKLNSIAQLTSDPAIRSALTTVYGTIHNIEAFVGGLAEDHLPGSSVGSTLEASFIDQFTRLRDGDRFFYTGDSELQNPIVSGVIDLDNLTLSSIIRNNTSVANLQDNVFFAAPGFRITETDGDTIVGESGGVDSFLVSLTSAPTSDVVISVSSEDVAEVAGGIAPLIFTPSDWNTPQPVTVTGVNDGLPDGDQVTAVTVSVADADSANEFDSVANQTVLVTTLDSEFPDLVGTAFDVATDHIRTAHSEITFTVHNNGNAPAGAFATSIVWSTNDTLGDSDDVVVTASMESFSGLAIGGSETRTIDVSLDKAALYANAHAVDSAGQSVGTRSSDTSHLFLIVDVNDDVTEHDETNNFGRGHLADSDDITYFPWDKDGNGIVTPVEALSSIQAINGTDANTDFDGNGIVTPMEALAVLERIGYVRNDDVIDGAADLTAGRWQTVSEVQGVGSTTSRLVAASPPPHEEEAVDLFPVDVEQLEPPAIPQDDQHVALDQSFAHSTEWLSIL